MPRTTSQLLKILNELNFGSLRSIKPKEDLTHRELTGEIDSDKISDPDRGGEITDYKTMPQNRGDRAKRGLLGLTIGSLGGSLKSHGRLFFKGAMGGAFGSVGREAASRGLATKDIRDVQGKLQGSMEKKLAAVRAIDQKLKLLHPQAVAAAKGADQATVTRLQKSMDDLKRLKAAHNKDIQQKSRRMQDLDTRSYNIQQTGSAYGYDETGDDDPFEKYLKKIKSKQTSKSASSAAEREIRDEVTDARTRLR